MHSTVRIRVATTLLVAVLIVSCSAQESKPTLVAAPIDLEVGEGFDNPLGYYELTPRFSWKLAPTANYSFQSAYQVQAASNPESLKSGADLWDSQKTISSDTSWIRYQGKALASRQRVFWRVRVWDEDERASAWSDFQTLELGLLRNADWKGRWIGHPDTASNKEPSKEAFATPQYLRNSFVISGDVQHARLYITAKGLFKPFINGAPVAEKDVMTPGWTPYSKRLETLTYDVSQKLNPGDNTIAVSLAGGWYSGRVGGQIEKDHRLPPRLLAQLEVTYRDGETQVFETNDTWKATQQGPIRFASIYDGERYSQAYELPGWTKVGFDDSDWASAIEEPLDDRVKLRPKRHSPIRVVQEMPAIELVSTGEGVAVFDLGQNLVGVPRITVPAVARQEITVRFAEALHKGEFYTDNYRSAHSTDYVLPDRTGTLEYQPTFTYHGFRYVEINGYDSSQVPAKDWLTALVQHSDVELHASFESSHAKLNQLSRNILWGLRGNFYDIPLDCPQRDERLGWTGDAQVFAGASMYMADVYGFWSAWLQSMREEQREDGSIPHYVPFGEWINWTSSGWGDAATIIPWELYVLTGDQTILEDNYEMMTRWLGFHQSQSESHISNMQTFGDWLQPYPHLEGKDGNRGDTDFSLISTAFYARSVELTSNAAEVLAKEADVGRLSDLHGQIKVAFRNNFFDERLWPRAGDATQTAFLLGLAFDLFSEQEKPLAEQRLIELIDQADGHLRTGFLGTPLLTSILQEAGRSDLAYELLLKETYPSWFHSINNGATTTWERWNSYSSTEGFNPQRMNSLNHYAYGSVSRWFYEGILGITPAEPGFKRIRIEPQFGSKLTRARGNYPTPHGDVAVDWQIDNEALTMSVTVPKNSVADVILPTVERGSVTINGEVNRANKIDGLSPGRYEFVASVSDVAIGESSDLLILEAEDFVSQENDEVRRWVRIDDDSASGGAYLELTPDTRKTHDDELIRGENFSDVRGAMAVLSYPVFFSQPGRYYIWARAFSTGSEDNSVHFGLNNEWPETAGRMQWCDGKHQWTWSSARRVPDDHCGEALTNWLDVPVKGNYTLNVSMREDGAKLDKIILVRSRSFVPGIELDNGQ